MNRNKEHDKSQTRKLILELTRPPYIGGENWLGHGVRDGKNAQIDYLLLDGATMDELLKLRNTKGSIRAHFRNLKLTHDLPVTRGIDGRYQFDREYLGIASDMGSDPQPLPEEVPHSEGLIEGSIRIISVNAYERNPKARELCIAHYGSICVVCRFSFETAYGMSAKGFIHVHHLKPLAEIREEYTIDPIKDLRPVCPNCHAVIHLSSVPKTIGQVQRMLRSKAC